MLFVLGLIGPVLCAKRVNLCVISACFVSSVAVELPLSPGMSLVLGNKLCLKFSSISFFSIILVDPCLHFHVNNLCS